jgi:hypothetical protein
MGNKIISFPERDKASNEKDTIYVGVVGYCPPTEFNEEAARWMIIDAYNAIARRFPDKTIWVVSGLTNVGVLKIAYEEAARRGWKTMGVACAKAKDFELFPVDQAIIKGDEWGDETASFLSIINILIRLGLGKQSLEEARIAKEMGAIVISYDLQAI